MKYTVKKNRANRIAMRITASAFIMIAALRFVVVMISEEHKSMLLTVILCVGCLSYGIVLLRQTFKAQAYDITYIFGEKKLTLKFRQKELMIGYEEIGDLGYVVPNDNLDYSIIQMYIGTEQYVIPFMGKSDVGKALYEMLKLKKEETEMSLENDTQ